MIITIKHKSTKKEKLTPKNIIDLLLEIRGVKDREEFLHPTSPIDIELHDFDTSYKKLIKTVITILEWVKAGGGTVMVYCDYDADGITGGSILWETLHLLGFKAMPYVPHRMKEGYGFSKIGINAMKKQYDPALIISVDHGITAREQIEYAATLGIEVIVTDHHLKPEKIPEAAKAIFHIPALSGSGVSYVFSKALFNHFKKDLADDKRDMLQKNFEGDYLSLASIGSIADLVPLTGATRRIVTYGLKAFAHTKRPGFVELFAQCALTGKPITPYEVGFVIAPRINAIGRLEHAIDALRLLCTTDTIRARNLASRVGEQNKLRQDMVVQSVEEAVALIDKKYANKIIPKVLIIHSPKWHEGIIGLIASRLVEKYSRPSIVMTQSDGFLKGSARSMPALHMTDFLRNRRSLFIDVGGHSGAAGFTIQKENLDEMIRTLEGDAEKLLTDEDLIPKIAADLEVPLDIVTEDLVNQLEQMSPFGIGNPRPVFVSTITLANAQLFGSTNTHLKFFAQENGIEFIMFNKSSLFSTLSRETQYTIVYTPDINRWNGRTKLQAKVQYLESRSV
jgi:single-stranded-DNA-specific exonuclease